MNISERAVSFIRQLFHIYLEQRDFDSFVKMFDDNISWIGTGGHEVCRNLAEAKKLIEAERHSWNGKFDILDQWYQAIPLGSEICVVYGELNICENGRNSILIDMHSRFSMVCRICGDDTKLIHAHFSVPNQGQKETEFVHKTLIKDYNELLEQKLEERTRLLNDKATQIETLMSNIQGGVEITECNGPLNILYVNDGFCRLVGYSKKEIAEVFHNKHEHLVFSDDLDNMRSQIALQLEQGDQFAVEYRIKKKDGSIIWVLDKGKRILTTTGKQQVQCVLTDITAQKSLENELKMQSIEMRSIYDNVSFGIIRSRVSKGDGCSYINPMALKILGRSREQFERELGNSLRKAIVDDDLCKAETFVQELLETGEPIHGKIGVKRGDGGVILLDGYGVVINDRDGNKVCIYTFEDVTVEEANKEMLISKNKELTISEKRYEIAMRNSSDIVFDYLVDTKEIICDHCVNKKLGLMEHVNESVETIISLGGVHPNSVQTFRELFNKIDHGETTAKATIVLYGVSGEETINDILLTNVFDEYGNPIRAIGVITDISGTVTLETERRYREAMMYGKVLAYEANVTRDIITSIDDEWSKTLGISRRVSFSNMIEYLAEHVVHPDFIDEFKRFSSYETIEAAFCSGKVKETFEYLRKDPNGVYVWVGNKMNIIKDGITDDIRVRCYVNEINEQKKKELRVLEEQRFYDTMISKAVTVYAVNITMNLVLGGHEEWEERFTVAPTSSYSQMIQRYTEKSIHPDDREKFKQCYLRANVMNAYEQGKREIFCEYRRLEALKEYKWVSCSLHLFEDPDTADIKAFSYVQNIDGEKKRELELLYKAEHDSLTGYYNKSAIEQKVNEFLLTRNGELKNHAFLIFDIDYFKAVNDNFGHAWGDTILMKIAKKVRNLFREEDILGRIGGDEFVILMKNITSEQAVFEKARELCNTTKVAFVHEGEEFKISTSVGIAISNIHGKTYGTLYKKSDIALYVSKNNGRDQFAIYDKSMNEKTTPMIDIIDIEQS